MRAAHAAETKLRKARGKKEDSVRQAVSDFGNENCEVKMSSHHGGDVEGPSVES